MQMHDCHDDEYHNIFGIGMKLDSLHVSAAQALLKTALAARKSAVPRSTSAQRRRSSAFHLADRPAISGASRLSISFSATNALKEGGNSNASDTTFSAVIFIPLVYLLFGDHQSRLSDPGKMSIQSASGLLRHFAWIRGFYDQERRVILGVIPDAHERFECNGEQISLGGDGVLAGQGHDDPALHDQQVDV